MTQSGKISKYKASFIDIYWGLEKLPGTVASEGKGKTGIIRINEQTIRIVDNQIQDQEDFFADMMGNGFSFDVRAKRSAKFSERRCSSGASIRTAEAKQSEVTSK